MMTKENIFGITVAVFIFFPWLLGLVDLASWIMIGHQLSSMPWTSDRGLAAMWWPIGWVCAIAITGALT